MYSNEDRVKIMRDDAIPAALLKLGLPMIMGMLINALYNVVDAYFVGGLGTSPMGAVSVAFPLVQVVIGVGLIFGCGGAMCIARQLGEGDWERASRTASTAVFGSLAAGCAATVLSLLFLDDILALLGATGTILPYARLYAVVYLSFCLLHVFCITMNNLVVAEGAANMSMFAMLLGGGLNALLDPLFIYAFGWGVGGAAAATVVAQGTTALVYLWYIVGKRGCLKISPKRFTLRGGTCRGIVRLGVPIFVFQLLFGIAMGMTNTAASRYGDSAVAAMGIVSRVLALAAYVLYGYVKGFQPVAGYNYGAKNFARLNESIKVSLRWVLGYCLLVAVLLLAFPGVIMRVFSANDAQLVALGVKTLRANALAFPLFGVVMVYSTLFLAMGKARVGGFLSVARQGIFFIPAILILPGVMGLDGMIYSQPLADVLSFALTIPFVIPLVKWLRDPGGQEGALCVVAVAEGDE